MARISATPGGRPRRAVTGALVVVALALVVGFALAAVQAKRVHDRYGTWALSPGAHTPVITFHGRNYDRGDRLKALPAGVEEVGSAPGNGEIFSAPPIPGIAPTVLYVRYPGGTAFGYVLSGGP